MLLRCTIYRPLPEGGGRALGIASWFALTEATILLASLTMHLLSGVSLVNDSVVASAVLYPTYASLRRRLSVAS